MAEQVYEVKHLDVGKSGNRFYLYFASHHRTVDELVQDLKENTLVAGVRLICRKGGGEIEVKDTTPYALSKHSVYSISLPALPVRRYED